MDYGHSKRLVCKNKIPMLIYVTKLIRRRFIVVGKVHSIVINFDKRYEAQG